MSKRFSFEIKITGILLIIMTLVALTGVFAYQRFSGVVNKISSGARPDMKLLTAKALINELNIAEISVKSYRITEDSVYLNSFYNAVQNIDSKLEAFKDLSGDHGRIEPDLKINVLDSLIGEKMIVLNNLLLLQDGFRTQKALDKVMAEIEKKDTAITRESSPERKNFLEGIFKQRKKVASQPDTILTVEKVNREVYEIKTEELILQKAFKEKELEFILQDQLLSNQIEAFFNEVETAEMEKINVQAKEAETAIIKTNRQIALFCIITGLFVIFMAFIIINYVRNNNRYRKALKKSKNRAEDLAKTKQKFLDNMSHEIRTPMNAIAGFSEQIGLGPLTDGQKEQLTMVQKSTDHLLYLINEMLDLSKLHAEKIALEKITFRPQELMEDVIRILSNEAKSKNLEIRTEMKGNIPEVLMGDPYRLRQILLNIMGNAIKFTEKGGVCLTARATMTNGKSCNLNIKIEDTGIGIEKKNLQKIFNEFEQAEASTTRNFGGSGLGLAIVKLLVNLHEGEVEVESEYGVGTTVVIDLPYEISSEKELEPIIVPVIEPKTNLDGLAILIADDEKFNRLLIVSILKKYNVKYTEVVNGEEAIREMEKNHYDLILMDIRMPIIDGVQACKIIRKKKDAEKRNIPIIALTAAVSEKDRETYRKVGMSGFLAKPFKEAELLAEMEVCMNRPAFEHVQESKEMKNTNDEVIDLAGLRTLSGNDMAFYNDMLHTFIDGTSTGMKIITRSLTEQNWSNMAEQAHKISSPCNHLGALNLYEILRKIEHNCRNLTDMEAIPDLVERMKVEGAAVLAAVQHEIDTLKGV